MLEELTRPFRVVDNEKNFHSGWNTLEDAKAKEEECNKAAIAMGIKTRYSTIQMPV